MPMLFDEWAHVACYNNFELKEDPNVRNFWGQSLDSMWTNSFESDGGLGGAIWCMIDETFMLPEDLDGFNEWWGILDPNIIPATYMGPMWAMANGELLIPGAAKNLSFGEQKKPIHQLKFTPKEIDDFKSGEPLKIPVHNRFDHTNFNELKITWKYGNQSGVLKNVNLEPHQKGELFFRKTTGKSGKMNIQFFQNDTILVDEYNIQLGEEEIELPICEKGNLTLKESENIISISGKDFVLDVNKKTGLLENV